MIEGNPSEHLGHSIARKRCIVFEVDTSDIYPARELGEDVSGQLSFVRISCDVVTGSDTGSASNIIEAYPSKELGLCPSTDDLSSSVVVLDREIE